MFLSTGQLQLDTITRDAYISYSLWRQRYSPTRWCVQGLLCCQVSGSSGRVSVRRTRSKTPPPKCRWAQSRCTDCIPGRVKHDRAKTKTVNNNMRSHPAAIRPLWVHMLCIWTQCICWDHSWRGSILPAAQSARTPRTDMRWGSGWAAQVPAGCAQLSFSATGVTWSHCGGHVTGSCSSASSNNKSTSYFLVLHKLGVSGNANT